MTIKSMLGFIRFVGDILYRDLKERSFREDRERALVDALQSLRQAELAYEAELVDDKSV